MTSPRFGLTALLVGGALVAAACSSFTASEAPSTTIGDAGEDTAPIVTVDADAPDAGPSCETVTFDLTASPVGAGWTERFVDDVVGASLVPIAEGLRASVDANHFGARAALAYRIPHRETVTRLTLKGTFATPSTVNDSWPVVSVRVKNDDVTAGYVELQQAPMTVARAGYVTGDGGGYQPRVQAGIGSFAVGVPVPVELTLDGPWRTGPTLSLLANGLPAADFPSGALPTLADDAGSDASIEVAVGIVVAPTSGAILELRAMQLEICRR